MAKVYITQIPCRRDKETGALTPTVNVGPAHEHGDSVVVMMPPQASFFATNEMMNQIANHLSAYDFEDGDSIVALGDPVVIGATCAYLGKTRSKFTMLRWDRQLGKYLRIVIKV